MHHVFHASMRIDLREHGFEAFAISTFRRNWVGKMIDTTGASSLAAFTFTQTSEFCFCIFTTILNSPAKHLLSKTVVIGVVARHFLSQSCACGGVGKQGVEHKCRTHRQGKEQKANSNN